MMPLLTTLVTTPWPCNTVEHERLMSSESSGLVNVGLVKQNTSYRGIKTRSNQSLDHTLYIGRYVYLINVDRLRRGREFAAFPCIDHAFTNDQHAQSTAGPTQSNVHVTYSQTEHTFVKLARGEVVWDLVYHTLMHGCGLLKSLRHSARLLHAPALCCSRANS